MRILLSLLLCVYVTARVVPAVSGSVPDLLLIQNAKVQGGTQQPTKPLVTTSTGSSKIYMSKSKDAIQYSYIIEAVTGTTMAKLNVTIAQIDQQQKIAFAKETNTKVKSYFKSKTKSGYGGMLSVGLGLLLPYFAGYYLDSVVQDLAKNPQIKAIVQNVGGVKRRANILTDIKVPWHLYKMSANPKYVNYDEQGQNTPLTYRYLEYAGAGVPIYIVDDVWGNIQLSKYVNPPIMLARRVVNSMEDSHGMMVAAFAARRDVGVAKKAQILMIDSGDSLEDVVDAVEAAIFDYHMVRKKSYYGRAVINLSIGFDEIFDHSIIREYITSCLRRFPFITFVVAAGGEYVDACTCDFSRAPEAIVVSGLNQLLELTSGFPYGKCVDILAPGYNLEYEDLLQSGTSLSAPIVSGLVAYFYSLAPIMNSQYMARNGDMKQMLRRYALPAKLAPGERDMGTPLLIANNGISYF